MAGDDKIDTRLELLATLLLSLATIATAWSVYEAARWSGVQATEFSNAGSARTKAAAQLTVGAEISSLETALFTEYQRAERAGDLGALADLRETFARGEFGRVFEAWRSGQGGQEARSPFDLAPLGAEFALADRSWRRHLEGRAPPAVQPLLLDGYRPSAFARSDALTNTADLSREAAKRANQTSDNYVLTTVLFALVLFFAGVSTKFASLLLQRASLAMGAGLFTAGTLVLLRLPFH